MTEYNLGTAKGVIEIEYKGDGAKKAREDLKRTTKGSDDTSKALKGVGNKAGIAGLLLAGGFALATKTAADFESQMSGIAAVSGASAKELEQLRNKALQLGKDTQYSASESAAAIQELVKAGIPIADVMNGAADSVVALAAAGGVDMPTAATIASNAMNQFGIKAKDMKGVVDSIAGAANASAIDVTDLGQSMSQVGAVANLAGLNFHDTAIAIAEMGNAGIKGSDAGTSLKSFLSRIVPLTDSAAAEMEHLGLITYKGTTAMKELAKLGLKPASAGYADVRKKLMAYAASTYGYTKGSKQAKDWTDRFIQSNGILKNQLYDSKGKLKDLSQVQDILAKSLKGMTAEQKQASLNTIFGSDAIRAAAILANNGAKGYDKMNKAIGKVSAADVAAKRMDNFKGSMEQFKGSVETLGITVGQALLPAMRSVIDALTGVANWFLNLDKGTQTIIVSFLGAVGVILLIVAAVIKTVQAFTLMSETLGILKLAFASTWVAALGPIALIIAAIALVIGIIVLLWMKNEKFREIVLKVWEAIKKAAMAVADWFMNTLLPTLSAVWDGIVKGVQAIVGFFVDAWNKIYGAVEFAVNLIKTIITTYIRIWIAIISTAIAILKGIWEGFWKLFGGIIKAAWNLIVAILKLGWTIVKGIFLLYLNAIKLVWTTIWNALVTAFQFVWNLIVTVVTTYINIVRTIITTVWNGILAFASAVWNGILAVISFVWGLIGGKVLAAVGLVKGYITGAWNAITTKTSEIWNGLLGVISGAWDTIATFIGGLKDKVLGFFADAGNWLLDAGGKIIQGLVDGITGAISKVTDAISSVTSIIADHLPGSPVKTGPLKVLNNGYTGRKVVEMVAGGVQDMRPQLAKVVQTVVGVPALTNDLNRASSAGATTLATAGGASSGLSAGSGTIGAATKSKLVSGTLSIDKSGRAFISGVAEDVLDGNERFASAYGRMG